LRELTGIDEPPNVSSAYVKKFGDVLNVKHDGRRVRPFADGVSASGGNMRGHVEFSK
jgi:hypothetical protein